MRADIAMLALVLAVSFSAITISLIGVQRQIERCAVVLEEIVEEVGIRSYFGE